MWVLTPQPALGTALKSNLSAEVFNLCTYVCRGKKMLLCSLPPHLLTEISFTAKMSNWLIYGVRGIF